MLLFFIIGKSFQNDFKQRFFISGWNYEISDVKSLLVSFCVVIMLLPFFLQLFVLSRTSISVVLEVFLITFTEALSIPPQEKPIFRVKTKRKRSSIRRNVNFRQFSGWWLKRIFSLPGHNFITVTQTRLLANFRPFKLRVPPRGAKWSLF